MPDDAPDFERLLREIQVCTRDRRVHITLHARTEMLDDEVSTPQLVCALLSENLTVVEDYPKDRRGHSHLLLGWLDAESPLHICCALSEGRLIIITVYRPDPAEWTDDWRQRT
jgi:hypothetical protein